MGTQKGDAKTAVCFPRQPSNWSRVSSTRSELPSTRYMIFSGLPSPVYSAARSRSHPATAAASSV